MRADRLVAGALLALLLAGCSALSGSPPAPTPLDFPGIADQIVRQGLGIDRPIAGDAGCSDPTLVATAIGFDVSGKGLTAPQRARVYIFANRAAYERRRADVDVCVGTWATDPAAMEFIDASPYVLAIQGPIPDAAEASLRAALVAAAGNGG
jgi:hypothetical protein